MESRALGVVGEKMEKRKTSGKSTEVAQIKRTEATGYSGLNNSPTFSHFPRF